MSSLPTSSSSLAIVLSLLLLSRPGSTVAAADGQPPSKPIVTPVTKDPFTNLYTIPIINSGGAGRAVLDLAGSLVWSTLCQEGHRTIPCKSSVCTVANRNHPASCAWSKIGGYAGNADPRCACSAYPYNPASGQCGIGDLTVLPLAANATDGNHPLFPVSFNVVGSCARDTLLESLPSGAAGVAGLSRLPLSLPSQVASKLKVPKQFALCLGDTGAAIFGGGPFVLQTGMPGPVDFSQGQDSQLPLVKNPKNGAYYFRVHGIAVNQELVPGIAPGALDLDARSGKGGVVFSTTTRYTTLRSDIFNAVITAFEKSTSVFTRVKPPPPHDLCFQTSAFTGTAFGPGFANIDLMLDNGRNWTLLAPSTLVSVGQELYCFAFENMGYPASEAPDAPAIIFGTHQMEDSVVQFDLDKNTFGFSGLLRGARTSCGNFNMGS